MNGIRRRYRSLLVALLALGALFGASSAWAHNASVHRDMTERAWEIMTGLARDQLDAPSDPATLALAAAAKSAIRKLQGLPAGLPPPKQTQCADLDLIRRFGSSPNWGVSTADFGQLTLGAVPFPISLTYLTGNDCGIDPDWAPGAFFDSINSPRSPLGQDLTGVVLGFWAHQPDDEADDWHIFFRAPNVTGLSVIKSYIDGVLGAGAATVWIPLRCALKCIGAFLGIGGSCKQCLDEAIAEAQGVAHDGVAAIDGLAPGFGDHTSLALYTGMGHHINVAPPLGLPGPWKLNPAAYDDRPGLLVENAGPIGVPDPVEFATMGLADGLGMTVHYDPSRGPKRYEIRNRGDAHPDSVARGENDWQFLSFVHTPFTPIDNLARAGWDDFRGEPARHVRDLGWALHAFGDAIVPMHVAGTFGWGHRPYEDAFEQRFPGYLNTKDPVAAKLQALDIVRRATAWRQFILDWRAQNPTNPNDIPLRDIITRLAQFTWGRVFGPAVLVWPFNVTMSSQYLGPVVGKGIAIGYYELAPGADAVNRDLTAEGIAAEMAFIISAAEVLP